MSKTKHLETLLSLGSISRRQFLERAATLGVATPIVTSLCARAVAAATPKKGGHFSVGIGHGATSDTFDPSTTNDTYMQSVGFAVRNCLTELNSEDELVGELAENWDVTPDAKTWTFKLRKGVEFHNGKSFGADDVIASIQFHLGEDSSSPVKGFLKSITDIKSDGDDRVTISLSEGNADFPYLLSDYHVMIMPARDGRVEPHSGIGTGGYVLKRFEPGVTTELERNTNYWKENHANFDTIEVLSILDANARTTALRTGDVHCIDRVELKTADYLAKEPDISVKETSGTQHYAYSMLCNVAPFDNVDVRLALKHGIDRQAFLDKVLRGHGYLGNDHPIGKSNTYYAADLDQRHYDPDKAKYYLKKAGLTSLKVGLSAADAAFSGALDGATLYREAASPAGVKIDVIREPNDGYWSDVWQAKPWFATYWAGRATEDWMFSLAYSADAPWNETGWINERFNQILVEARAELNTDKRRQMYREMQQLCRDDGGTVVPAFSNYVFALSDKIAHRRLSAAWDLDGIKGLERWWFS